MFQNRLLSVQKPPGNQSPFISVAIPHYRHRRYLEIVLQSLLDQQYEDFEIVVSNDRSPDDSDEFIPEMLKQSGRNFSYYSQPTNLGYDGNVRFCLDVSQGQYVFLLGNDDALAHPQILKQLDIALRQLNFPDVAFTNFKDWQSDQVTQRALKTQILGSGVETALKFYRSFSFVSGLIFDRTKATEHQTERWDQSIYYQIYLACRIISEHGRLGAIDVVAVRKDVCIDGDHVPNYVTKWSNAPRSFEERHTGVDSVIRVTWDAIQPFVLNPEQSRYLCRLFSNALLTLYPYWVLEYRRIANWHVAVGVARAHWPGKLFKEYDLIFSHKLFLWALYLVVTFPALIVPASVFTKTKSYVANMLRRRQQGL